MLNEMAPYLLLGFGLSGILSVLVSQDKIQDKKFREEEMKIEKEV